MSSMPNRSSLRIWSPPFGASSRTRNKRPTSGFNRMSPDRAWPRCVGQAARRGRRGDRGMRRREFITLLGGAAAAWPIAARAQQRERTRRIGVLINFAADDPAAQSRLTAFLQGLAQLGWTEGGNAHIDIR